MQTFINYFSGSEAQQRADRPCDERAQDQACRDRRPAPVQRLQPHKTADLPPARADAAQHAEELRPLGHIGLALATSLTGLLVSVLALLDLRKMGLHMFQQKQLPDFLKIVASSAGSLLGCVLCYELLLPSGGNTLALIAAACVAVALYGFLSIVLKIRIFMWIYHRIPKQLQVFSFLSRAAEE